MAANIRDEIRRLHRRKQLNLQPQTSDDNPSNVEGSSNAAKSSACTANSVSHNSSGKEKSLFTFRQVSFYINFNIHKTSNIVSHSLN